VPGRQRSQGGPRLCVFFEILMGKPLGFDKSNGQRGGPMPASPMLGRRPRQTRYVGSRCRRSANLDPSLPAPEINATNHPSDATGEARSSQSGDKGTEPWTAP